MSTQRRLDQLEHQAGLVRCPHCRGVLPDSLVRSHADTLRSTVQAGRELETYLRQRRGLPRLTLEQAVQADRDLEAWLAERRALAAMTPEQRDREIADICTAAIEREGKA